MKRRALILITLLCCQLTVGQFPEKALRNKLKADKIEMDQGNGDGVFKARNKKTKKWGMYQWLYEGLKTKELIPMAYDAVNYFPFNGAFTAVYNNGKVGFYLSAWSYKNAKQTVPCLYDDYQRFTVNNTPYLAVQKNGRWGWVDWLTGEEQTECKYDTQEDLPYPGYKQNIWPED